MSAAMFVLAHLSDPHLAPLPRPHLSELLSKRGLGYINWRRSRSIIHRSETLEAIRQDLAGQRPDHIAVTGDLVNIALPAEFANARAWLDRLGPAADVSVVPGNHDAYVDTAAAQFAALWAPYMAADGQDSSTPVSFPYVRRRGAVALVGLSSAVATGPLMATGRLGVPQIARAAQILDELRAAHLFRVVMIHHPPHIPPTSHFKRLIDAAAFRDAIVGAGAELVIHGHDHVHSVAWITGRDGDVPVIGVPSASAAVGPGHEGAAYNLYRVGGGPGAWTCEATSRGIDQHGRIGELRRFDLSGAGRV
jgi:3',5'-cyclic AMP phosphodiesterase CpdA